MSDCNSCQFKRNIPGDCHISCGHPVFTSDPNLAFKVNIALMTGNQKLIKPYLGLDFSEYGISSGWCSFPVNYDPIWVSGECNLRAISEKSKFNVGTVGHIEHGKSTLSQSIK